MTARFDFLALDPTEVSAPASRRAGEKRSKERYEDILVPREVTTWVMESGGSDEAAESAETGLVARTTAYVPFGYVDDARLRIGIYRRLAQATGQAEPDPLRKAMPERIGPVPAGGGSPPPVGALD